MGNDEPKKVNLPPPPTKMEIKTFLMVCQQKFNLYRNKKVYEIKTKKNEAVNSLKQNNLDVAKAKMESVIRAEDMITVFDILGPVCEMLKEKVNYIYEAHEVPVDIRAHLDTLIYASTRCEVDDLMNLRNLIGRKFGQFYLNKADANTDGLVNVNIIEKLSIRQANDSYLIIRLKQLCREKQIKYDFPEEIAPNFNQMINNNPFGGNSGFGGNPYDMGGQAYGNQGNPGYSSGNNPNMGGGNPYDNMGNNMGGYQGPGGNDFDNYMKSQNAGMFNNNNGFGGNNMGNNFPPSDNNSNPYAANDNNSNPYAANDNNSNPYAADNNAGNPYGGNDNSGNPYAGNDNSGNPYGGNPYGGNDNNSNPYA